MNELGFYLAGCRITLNRQRIMDFGEMDDEGLTPRALGCLLRLIDGDPLSVQDAAWLTDGTEPHPIAHKVGADLLLTLHGWQIARAVEAGDVEDYYRLTTREEQHAPS